MGHIWCLENSCWLRQGFLWVVGYPLIPHCLLQGRQAGSLTSTFFQVINCAWENSKANTLHNIKQSIQTCRNGKSSWGHASSQTHAAQYRAPGAARLQDCELGSSHLLPPTLSAAGAHSWKNCVPAACLCLSCRSAELSKLVILMFAYTLIILE